VFYDGENLEVFRGEVRGEVAKYPRGELGIGTDSIFVPEGYGGRTRAELGQDEYDEVYAKVRPIEAVRKYLKERYG
ncbi:non-canonical purine NTP pyrophosphatase, partial [Klebsiella pneumoniae]|uniref:non-canonical purine NTP pyrophosphatase n=1 Tax=Klebsiella pneumoniae TaxID=573 RepID=UPI0025A070D8